MKLINATALDRKSGDKLFVASARNYRGVSCVPQSPGRFQCRIADLFGRDSNCVKMHAGEYLRVVTGGLSRRRHTCCLEFS